MKKTGLSKIIMFILLGMVVVTWFVSASYYEGEVVELGMYNIGFFDYFQLLIGSFEFSYFIQILILLVSIGALYGVLGKTGKYRALVEKIAQNLKGIELLFLIIVATIIAIFTSIFDYGLILFIFFPFIISIILLMGYDKITALLTTFGAMLVGTFGSTLGYNTAGTINNALKVTLDNQPAIYFKLGLLVLSLIALIIVLSKAKRSTKNKEENKDDMFLGEKKSNKFSVIPIIVVFALLFILMILGCTNWSDTFGFTGFSTLHDKIVNKTFNIPYVHITTEGFDTGKEEVAIFSKIIGQAGAFGEWYYNEMAIMCFLAALVIGLFYRIKFKEVFDYMAEGAKKMARPALLIMFAYSVIYFAGNTLFFPTITENLLGITSKFNLFLNTLIISVGSVLHVDILYVANYMIPHLATQDIGAGVLAVLIQGIYGFTMFLAPTSAAVVLGLSYLGVSYKEWIKRVWKLALILFAIAIVATVILILI